MQSFRQIRTVCIRHMLFPGRATIVPGGMAMKTIWKEIGIAMFMGVVVPGFLLWFGNALLEVREEQTWEPVPETVTPEPANRYEVPVRTGDTVTQQDVEDYLVGVVLAEMPASFELEALKAQAVVARTYTMRAASTVGKHGDGSVCTDYACCQAYIDPAEYIHKGGTKESLEKIKTAVRDTAGEVLTYEGKLIEATYFSCSGGSTEDAVAVWGNDYPYLQAVDSPGEEHAAHYTDTVSFTPKQLQSALGVTLSGSPEEWFGTVTYTEGGGVDTIQIGGKAYRGTQLRQLLSLRSTAFTVSVGEDISFTTKGFGHRVGMSQYGADAMALSGKGYEEILTHYYQGTVLTGLDSVEN